jgi:hypothetical protein
MRIKGWLWKRENMCIKPLNPLKGTFPGYYKVPFRGFRGAFFQRLILIIYVIVYTAGEPCPAVTINKLLASNLITK